MASSLHFTTPYLFHPIGNTTPVCLTRDLPPDVPANILLLPCGDPRNVLYTIFCERSNRVRKSLDFTCCDHDPSILARDVLLLTMVMDRVANPIVWNVFYHMYLDLDSRSTLVSQCQKLASYASLQAWRASPYGSVIKMGTDYTFAELRRHWDLYADFYHPSNVHRLEALQEAMDHALKEALPFNDKNMAIRSCGLFCIVTSQFETTGSLFHDLYQHYCETGTTITDKTRLVASTHPNSTFLYSRAGEGFKLVPKTDPIIPFAHDALFGNAGNRTLSIEDLVDSAQSQFRTWCAAFRTVTMKKTSGQTTPIVVRFLLGDALAIARAFQDFPHNPASGTLNHPWATPTVSPWTAFPMELNREEYADRGAPTRFDAIDTSDISDYLGLLNLLLATAPLLTRASSSVLYTQSSELYSSDPATEFEASLFASLSVVGILMDLVPIDVLSGFASTCNMHELLMAAVRSMDLNQDLLQQRFTWKRPSSGDLLAYPDGGPRVPVSFDTHQFAKLLHNIYLDTFRSGDPAHAPAIEKAVKGRNNALARSLLRGVLECPSREAFAVFLSFIRASLQISEEQWSDIMYSFLTMRSENQPHFDMLADSDLHVQLSRHGLHTASGLDHARNSVSSISEPGRLSFWPSVPPFIRVFLIVTRDDFARLEQNVAGVKPMLNVWMHGVIDHGQDQDPHIFQSVDAAYGTLVDTGTAAAPSLSFQEDPEGSKNGADLVVSFVVPSHILRVAEPPAPMVSLQVRSDFNTRGKLAIEVPGMSIFSANVEDTDYVYLLPEPQLPHAIPRSVRPSSPDPTRRSTRRSARPNEAGDIGYQHPVRVELDAAGKQVASLTAKLEITNPAAYTVFSAGTMPTVSQRSPCTVHVVLGTHKQIIAFPVPIVGSSGRRKVRIARKSSYIEVVVPIAIPFLEPDGYKVNQFPVVRANGSLVSWNIHRVFLDLLPVLDRANISDAPLESWYCAHLSSPRSLRERILFEEDLTRTDPLVNVKMTTGGILMVAAGFLEPPKRVFGLKPNPRKDPDMFLFIDKIRYDTTSHMMVLDAFALVLSEDILPHVRTALPRLAAGPAVMHAPVLGWEREMCLWRRILPALAERCRTTWTHRADCEYRVVQPDGSVHWQIPRGPPNSKRLGDPLCTCGRGRDVGGMMREGAWQAFAPFVTRIALSLLFGVAHVEQIVDPLESVEDFKSEEEAPGTLPPGPAVPVAAIRSKSMAKVRGTDLQDGAAK
ncbi:hypothetical protein GSI_10219 [Ganoderma sinense ZZ0214-1]|uniref:DUF4470 domain-containing protein n=1 Tax=Ganoderma sinense ZZ0214-1 TaxID=1077348 RepID=A0A2G8RZY3_9APHY|nr:hypothetical protein GSI_10219 [Ganoderma sinense ZZ0214-1]